MSDITIQQAKEHHANLSPHIQERATAKHLAAIIKVAERLFAKNNKLEMECRKLRQLVNDMDVL